MMMLEINCSSFFFVLYFDFIYLLHARKTVTTAVADIEEEPPTTHRIREPSKMGPTRPHNTAYTFSLQHP